MTPEELAQKFIDLYKDTGLDDVPVDEMTKRQYEASNKHYQNYLDCLDIVGK